ncbi:hypothetical protein [Aliiglaciecola lipolytica]|uniref:Solute-binding protein family 3/N-terminal domain-containing protein n=1 Tax=Aliiglaciecola lipolytica E3 TaxID=1127673 RepID=K6YRG2_9ALTE|nr:hypothetical protein [Aliiglaciecola lipolytica]GAC13890.1 hypothetical protein GLIP_1249 [Aliiglaciecola lipolytica E3]
MKLILILFFATLTFSVKSEEYTINVVEALKEDPSLQKLKDFYTEIYKSINYSPTFVFYPSKRGLKMVNEGELDAEALRLDLVGAQFEQLVQVDEPIGTLRAGYFCIKKSDCAVDDSSVLGVLATFRGAKSFCDRAKLNCQYIDTPTSMAKMMDTGLFDAIFATELEVGKILCNSSSEVFYYFEDKNFELTLYHFINVKHLKIKKRLEKAIRVASKSGRAAVQFPIEKLQNLTCEKSVKLLTD